MSKLQWYQKCTRVKNICRHMFISTNVFIISRLRTGEIRGHYAAVCYKYSEEQYVSIVQERDGGLSSLDLSRTEPRYWAISEAAFWRIPSISSCSGIVSRNTCFSKSRRSPC